MPMPMADWPNFSLSFIKPCDLIVECSAPGGQKKEELCMMSCDWLVPSLSTSLRNCTIDNISLSIAMAVRKTNKWVKPDVLIVSCGLPGRHNVLAPKKLSFPQLIMLSI